MSVDVIDTVGMMNQAVMADRPIRLDDDTMRSGAELIVLWSAVPEAVKDDAFGYVLDSTHFPLLVDAVTVGVTNSKISSDVTELRRSDVFTRELGLLMRGGNERTNEGHFRSITAIMMSRGASWRESGVFPISDKSRAAMANVFKPEEPEGVQ